MTADIMDYLEIEGNNMAVQIPNEIFKDLHPTNAKINGLKSAKHAPFAYSYYYLITYLYRNCVFGTTGNIQKFSQTNLRQKILGYASKTLNYIQKSGGMLDQMKYTSYTTEYPIEPIIDEGYLTGFSTLGDLKNEIGYDLATHGHGANFTCKVPLRGFYRNPNTDMSELDGTFFDYQDTHRISPLAFAVCMNNSKLGTVGFYMYSYFVMMTDKHKKGFDMSKKAMKERFGIGIETLRKYEQELEKEGLLQVIRYNTTDMANTYYATKHVEQAISNGMVKLKKAQ